MPSSAYITVFLVLIALALPLAYFLWDLVSRKRLLNKLRQAWGQPEALRRMDADELRDTARYYEALSAIQPPVSAVDDTTWGDLDMDSVFLGLDASVSTAGSEALYAILREQGTNIEALEARGYLADAFMQDEDLRLPAMAALHSIGRRSFHGAWRYMADAGFQSPAHPWVYRLLAVLPLMTVLLGLLHSAFLLAAPAAFLLNVFVHYRSQATWQKEVAAIRHLGAVIRCADRLGRIPHPAFARQREEIAAQRAKLRGIRLWLPLFGIEAFGDMAVVMEYLKIFLMLDMLSLVSIVGIITRHPEAVRALYALAGETDACLSIAQLQVREGGLCRAGFHEQRALRAQGLTHPLVRPCVPNTLDWRQNMLISGSNASGKSTFIKAVAVNAILAQTLGLCFAESFALRRGRVMSAMAVRDSIARGESYFVVEIKSLKRILDAAGSGMVYCFIDEILRGTNTIERVAASSAVLASLEQPDLLCMAATHDIELTRLLERQYDNRHFSEQVGEGGITFDYTLKPGPTQTRNAIRLLEQMGYDEALIKTARRRADGFEKTGAWQN